MLIAAGNYDLEQRILRSREVQRHLIENNTTEVDKALGLIEGTTKKQLEALVNIDKTIKDNAPNYPGEVYAFLRNHMLDQGSISILNRDINDYIEDFMKLEQAKQSGILGELAQEVQSFGMTMIGNKTAAVRQIAALHFKDENDAMNEMSDKIISEEFSRLRRQVAQYDQGIIKVAQQADKLNEMFTQLRMNTESIRNPQVNEMARAMFRRNDTSGVYENYKFVLNSFRNLNHMISPTSTDEVTLSQLQQQVVNIDRGMSEMVQQMRGITRNPKFNRVYNELGNLSRQWVVSMANEVKAGRREAKIDIQENGLIQAGTLLMDTLIGGMGEVMRKNRNHRDDGLLNINMDALVDIYHDTGILSRDLYDPNEMKETLQAFALNFAGKFKDEIVERLVRLSGNNLFRLMSGLDEHRFSLLIAGQLPLNGQLLQEGAAGIAQQQLQRNPLINDDQIDDAGDVVSALDQSSQISNEIRGVMQEQQERQQQQPVRERAEDLVEQQQRQRELNQQKFRLPFADRAGPTVYSGPKGQKPGRGASLYDVPQERIGLGEYKQRIRTYNQLDLQDEQRDIRMLQGEMRQQQEEMKKAAEEIEPTDLIRQNKMNQHIQQLDAIIQGSIMKTLKARNHLSYINVPPQHLAGQNQAMYIADFISRIDDVSGLVLSNVREKMTQGQLINQTDIDKVTAFEKLFEQRLEQIENMAQQEIRQLPQAIQDQVKSYRENKRAYKQALQYIKNSRQEMIGFNKQLLEDDLKFLDSAFDEVRIMSDGRSQQQAMNDAVFKQQEAIQSQINNWILKSGLGNVLRDPNAQREVQQIKTQAAQSIYPRMYAAPSNINMAGFGGKFAQETPYQQMMMQQQQPQGRQFLAYGNSRAVIQEGDGESDSQSRLSSEAVMKLGGLDGITQEELQFARNVYYDQELKKLMFKTSYDRNGRELTKPEQLKVIKIFVKLLVAMYAVTMKDLSQGERDQVRAQLMTKFATAGSKTGDKLIKAINRVAEGIDAEMKNSTGRV